MGHLYSQNICDTFVGQPTKLLWPMKNYHFPVVFKVCHWTIILIQKNYVNIIYFGTIKHKYFKHGLHF
jgi:hypothetical protein